MSSEYDNVRVGKLKIKGEKKKAKKRKHKSQNPQQVEAVDEDCELHGGWWRASRITDVVGAVCIEFGRHTYVKALDNGLFTLGAPHQEVEGPSPEEILTAVPIDERRIALKSGYGKYVSVNREGGLVTGRADAIGPQEHWEPVFQDGEMALQAFNGCFMSVNSEDDTLVAISRRAGSEQILQLRLQTIRQPTKAEDRPIEERGSLSQVELNYVKKFQKFQDKKLRISTEDKYQLKQAREQGNFHEKLLDRRSKMKADRYCK